MQWVGLVMLAMAVSPGAGRWVGWAFWAAGAVSAGSILLPLLLSGVAVVRSRTLGARTATTMVMTLTGLLTLPALVVAGFCGIVTVLVPLLEWMWPNGLGIFHGC
jgi:hypothetical protein